MEIQMPSHRQRHLPAPVLPVQQQEIEDSVGALGGTSPVPVERLSLLDETAALPGTGVDRGHHLARRVLEALAQVAVQTTPWVRVRERVL